MGESSRLKRAAMVAALGLLSLLVGAILRTPSMPKTFVEPALPYSQPTTSSVVTTTYGETWDGDGNHVTVTEVITKLVPRR